MLPTKQRTTHKYHAKWNPHSLMRVPIGRGLHAPKNSVVVFFKRWCELSATTITPLGEFSTLQRLKHWFCIQGSSWLNQPIGKIWVKMGSSSPKDRGENTTYSSRSWCVFFQILTFEICINKDFCHSRCRKPETKFLYEIVWCWVMKEASIEASKTLV